jgi:nucleotide-binding universal stress UspA family protein
MVWRLTMFERILVPLDGSDLGEMALPWAVEVAAALRSEIDIVGVSETSNEELRNMQRGYLERKAEQAAAQIRSRKPPSCSTATRRPSFFPMRARTTWDY